MNVSLCSMTRRFRFKFRRPIRGAFLGLLAGVLAASPLARGAGSPVNPANWPEPTRWISPAGSDENPGDSAQAPWRTFRHAIGRLQPGDCLGLLEGEYAPETTGLIRVSSADGAVQGTAERPVTIRAVDERKAVLRSDGLVAAVELQGVSHWRVLGLAAVGRDQKTEAVENYHLAKVGECRNIVFQRNLLAHSNRLGYNGNQQLLHVGNSLDVLVEENEFYFHHRHAANAWKSRRVVFRRNYVNPRGWRERGFSHEALVFYQSSDGIMENNISEGYNLGFQAHGGVTFDGRPGGSHNRFFGNLSIDAHNATRVDARLAPHTEPKPATGNHFKDFLVIRPRGHGIWLSSATDTLVENVTVIGGAQAGVAADERRDNPAEVLPGGATFTLRNALLLDNAAAVLVEGQTDWRAEHLNLAGNGVRFSGDVSPADEEARVAHVHAFSAAEIWPAGGSLTSIPDNSPLRGKGKDGAVIGADVSRRYVDGVLTDAPLWNGEGGAFPHGALVPGINDVPGASVFDVHLRLSR